MKRLPWYIARHYLGAGRRRGLLSLITWIALGGVTVGVTALVVVIGVMTGMQEDLRAKILESTHHVIVLEQGASLRLGSWRRVVDSVRAHPDVVAAVPFVFTQVSLVRRDASGQYAQPATLFGVQIDTTRTPATEMERRIVEGALSLAPPESGLPPLLVGELLANRMQLFPGDSVVVVAFENLRQDIFGGLNPTVRQYEVTGTFATGMYEYDSHNVYTTFESAQGLLGLDPDIASGIGVRVRDPGIAEEVANELEAALEFPYWVESWITTNRALFAALKLERLAMGLILFLIVVVAAFNIVSTLVMVVSDRTREIGILKAMGMTRAGILRVFVLQGAWIGVVGTAIGAAAGVVIAWAIERYELIRIPPEVYFVEHLPVSLRVSDLLMIVGASIAVAFAATVYPSLQAAKLEPVEAIRHE